MPADAQECGKEYIIVEGDSLANIARRTYGASAKWTVIFYANQDRLGAGSSLIAPGQAIRIPCFTDTEKLPPAATTEAATPNAPQEPIARSSEVQRIEFLTADDYVPFTDRALERGGMLTDVVISVMEKLNADLSKPIEFNVSWVNDWSAHLTPLLATRAFDMGFPWFKPPCQEFNSLDPGSQLRCRRFFFSDPLVEVPTLLFVKSDSTLQFNSDGELFGKILCRPAGYYAFIFDQDGRNWIKDSKITLLQPKTVADCFRLILEGSADAVAINEFTGRGAMASMGISDRIRAIDRPVSIDQLHVVIAKTHPNARTMLHYVNSALRRLRESGEYDKTVEKHLTRYWDTLAEQERELLQSKSASKTPPAE